MPNNNGLLLLAGLGALLFLGRGGAAKKPDEDKRFVASIGGGGPTSPAFNIQSYIDDLFGYTASVPVQPPVQFFFPPSTVVTSSGVPAVSETPPSIITPTTKVAIGGEGGETITASSLAVVRSEQIAKQRFAADVNVQPRTWGATIEANKIAEEAQRKVARERMAFNIAAQKAALLASREGQEAVFPISAPYQPTINFNANDADWTMNPFSKPGQSISVIDYSGIDDDADDGFTATGTYSSGVSTVDDEFVISGGMDSPMVFAGEEDDDSQFSVVSMEPVQSYYGRYGGEE